MKIISLAPSTTEILFALGMGSSLVANTIYCDYPPESKRIPKVGSWIRIDIEKLRPLKPDLVFTSSIVQEKIFQDAKKAGFQVVNIDPRTLHEIYESIQEVAKLVGAYETAQKIVRNLLRQEHDVRNNRLKKPIKLYIEEWPNPPMMSGNWVPDIVELIGARYGIIKSGELSREVTLKEVATFDPDLILLPYCGFGKNSNPTHLYNRPGWKELRAVKQDRVIPFDDSILNRPGPRIFEAIHAMYHLVKKYVPKDE